MKNTFFIFGLLMLFGLFAKAADKPVELQVDKLKIEIPIGFKLAPSVGGYFGENAQSSATISVKETIFKRPVLALAENVWKRNLKMLGQTAKPGQCEQCKATIRCSTLQFGKYLSMNFAPNRIVTVVQTAKNGALPASDLIRISEIQQ